MTAMERYTEWLNSSALNEAEKQELEDIRNDVSEIESRFFAPLEFGTAGLRGTMAVGLHHMNRHVVRHTTQAFANLILFEGREAVQRGVAIAYDCRNNSAAFAREAACVLAGNGIPVRIFDSLRPTPELSFAIREYGCIAGINITASHNPKEYNGYKVYWDDGAQLPPEHADVVAKESEKIPMFRGVVYIEYEQGCNKGLIKQMGVETDKMFMDMVLCQSITQEPIKKICDNFRVVFTPFHGTGHALVPRALHGIGIRHVIPVPEQMEVNGDFPTVASPNPEEKEGFKLATDLAVATKAHLVIGTDPDADRVGVLARTRKGGYLPLTGNQVGVLLLDYIIKARREFGSMPQNPALIKTIVTTNMAAEIARRNNIAVFNTFTGFKFMAEKIKEMEKTNSHHFILAFEESYGYLVGDQARDKDAVTASMLIAEMTAYHELQGKSLLDVLDALYVYYGYHMEETVNLVMPGLDGLAKMKTLMQQLRHKPPKAISGVNVVGVRDYQRGERIDLVKHSVAKIDLSGSNVLCYELQDGTEFLIRPSGTEPKIKIYILAKGTGERDCADRVNSYRLYAQELKNL